MADDIDALGNFLRSRDVPEKEILRVKTLLVSRTLTDVQRDDTPEAPSAQVELAAGEMDPDDDLDEELSMRKKASKKKQQVWNRGRSDLLGADHTQTRIILRAELEPGYCISNSGKIAIKVLHKLGQCYMLPEVDDMSYQYAGSSFPSTDSYGTVCKWCAKAKDFQSDQNSSCTNTSSWSEEEER